MRHPKRHRSPAHVLVALASLVVVLGVVAGGARGTPSPGSYYLALGDSIAYGYQPTKAKPGARAAAFDTGYVDVVAARLRRLSPELQVVNYGCPGESTVTFVRGRCPAFADRMELHDAFRGTQVDAAVSFLRAHPGDVSPITLTLFGNDWLPLLLDTCEQDLACVRKRGPEAIRAFESRLTSIVRRLRAAAPAAEIVVTGAWNPDPTQLAPLRSIYRSLESSIVRAAAPSQARVARMLPVFNPPARARARLCALTFICSKGDPHPTDAGYRAIADAVLRTLG